MAPSKPSTHTPKNTPKIRPRPNRPAQMQGQDQLYTAVCENQRFLQEMVQNLRQENGNLRKKLDERESSSGQPVEIDVNSIRNKNLKLKEENEVLQAENSKLKECKASLEQRLVGLQVEISTLNGKIQQRSLVQIKKEAQEDFSEQLFAYKTRISELERVNAHLLESHSQEAQKHQNLKQKYGRASQIIVALRETQKSLEAQLSETQSLRENNVKLQNRILTLEDHKIEVEELKNRILEMEHFYKTQNDQKDWKITSLNEECRRQRQANGRKAVELSEVRKDKKVLEESVRKLQVAVDDLIRAQVSAVFDSPPQQPKRGKKRQATE